MKKHPYLIVATLCFALFSGCELTTRPDCRLEVDYDYTRNVGIIVKNSAGENLFEPTAEGNLPGRDITVEYGGETYPLSEDKGWYDHTNGPYLTTGPYSYHDKRVVLRFGPFFEQQGEDRQFTINWGDGTSDKVVFHYTVTYEMAKDERGCRYSKAIWNYKIQVNGVLASGDSLIAEITK